MTFNAPTLPGNAGHHAVQFYGDAAGLCLSVADFLGDGIAAGQPLMVIATRKHRALIAAQLTVRRFDLPGLRRTGRLRLLDARQTLAQFVAGSRLDPVRCRRAIGALLEAASAGHDDCTVRVYGEMVDVLWRDGKRQQALALERLWNDLSRTRPFSLLCGYARAGFHHEPLRGDVEALHTHVHD